MIQYLLEVSLCSIGFISFYYLALRDKSFHHWNRAYLNATLIFSLLIPLLHIPIEEIIFLPQITQSANPQQVSAEMGIPWQTIILAMYMIGSAVMLFKFFTEFRQIEKIISGSIKEKFPNYSLVKLDREFPLCSFFNFIICHKNTDISQYELDHELTHIRQKHSYDKVFVELVKILLWFNPAIYLYQKNIHALHEFLADESVVDLYGNDAYQEYLIQSFTNQHLKLQTVNPFHSLIKKRIHMLNNKKNSTKSIFLFAIPIIVCLIFFISCEKTTKVVTLDQSELSKLNYTEDGKIILSDTIVIFDDETFEEEVRIVTSELTPEEYAEMRKKRDSSYTDQGIENNHSSSNVLNNVPLDDESIYITVVDTIVTFNENTYEESTKIVSTKLTLEEYEESMKLMNSTFEPFKEKSKTSNSKESSQALGRKINKINLNTNRDESDLITVIDTVVYFDDDTEKEMSKVLKSTLSREEYERRQKMKSIPVGELEKNAEVLKVVEGQLRQ